MRNLQVHEFFRQQEHNIVEARLEHDPLHCAHCSSNERMIQAIEIIAGLNQAILSRMDGVPKGTIFQFAQTSPATNTVYTSPPAPMDGVIRCLVLSGQGNVTVTLKTIAFGSTTIGTYAVDSIPVAIPFHLACPVGSVVTLSTDATTGSLVSFAAWLEPANMDGSEFTRMRR